MSSFHFKSLKRIVELSDRVIFITYRLFNVLPVRFYFEQNSKLNNDSTILILTSIIKYLWMIFILTWFNWRTFISEKCIYEFCDDNFDIAKNSSRCNYHRNILQTKQSSEHPKRIECDRLYFCGKIKFNNQPP